jgi:hypothetical protein
MLTRIAVGAGIAVMALVIIVIVAACVLLGGLVRALRGDA